MSKLEIKGLIYEANESISKAQNTKARLKNEILSALNEPLNFSLLFGCVKGLKRADEIIRKSQKDIQNLKNKLKESEGE